MKFCFAVLAVTSSVAMCYTTHPAATFGFGLCTLFSIVGVYFSHKKR